MKHTYHLDKHGRSICEGDTVITNDTKGTVVWDKRWVILTTDDKIVPLNKYPKNEIEIELPF